MFQVTHSECESADNSGFHVTSWVACRDLCKVFSNSGIGCSFSAWSSGSSQLNCRLYTVPFCQYLATCKLLGGPAYLTPPSPPAAWTPRTVAREGTQPQHRKHQLQQAQLVEQPGGHPLLVLGQRVVDMGRQPRCCQGEPRCHRGRAGSSGGILSCPLGHRVA